MRSAPIAFVAAVLVLLLGCGVPCMNVACGPCAPQITLNLIDSGSGAPVADASISPGGTCFADAAFSQCSVVDLTPGTYTFTVSAPGYADKVVEVTLPDDDAGPFTCCSCGYVPQTVNVALDPL